MKKKKIRKRNNNSLSRKKYIGLDPQVKNGLHKKYYLIKEENSYQIGTDDDKINNQKDDAEDNVYTNNWIEVKNNFCENIGTESIQKSDGKVFSKELKNIGTKIKNNWNHQEDIIPFDM